MAATANPLGTETAARVLARGGSAVDAAIAAQMVLGLVEPQSSGIGGGGFLLHYDAASRRVRAYDGRETAPIAAKPERFLDDRGEPLPFLKAVLDARSVGVPGLLAMLKLAHERHGKLPWAALFDPAIELAEQGFPISPRLHGLLAKDPGLRQDPAARAYFYLPDGSPRPVGARVRNPELAAVLKEVAQSGLTSFYAGRVARAIFASVRTRSTDADLAVSDLARYEAREREPVCGNYRRYRICGMPPPSSGGIGVLQILGILERVPMSALSPGSEAAAHWFAEAGRLAFADRAKYLGDPDFVRVPVAQLLDADYLARRSALMREGESLQSAAPGKLAAFGDRRLAQSLERSSTTHLSIVDPDGNAVALTSSVEQAFGSRIMAEGFLLNNQLTDFAFLPQREGSVVANAVAGGKRPLSSMAPTLVFAPDGELAAVLGSAGGSRIINYVARSIVALIDWDLGPSEALALPHVGSRNGPTELERGTGAERLAASLELRGHPVRVLDMNSGSQAIFRRNGRWEGAADPRREGAAEGD